MNRGQLIPAGIVLFMLISAIRVPPERLAILAERVLKLLENGTLIGYILSILFLILWGVHVKIMRGDMSWEMKRTGREKTELQEKLLDKNLGSSD